MSGVPGGNGAADVGSTLFPDLKVQMSRGAVWPGAVTALAAGIVFETTFEHEDGVNGGTS